MPKKKKDEVCDICKRVNSHAAHCLNRQCSACGKIGGKHLDDCFVIRDAIKPYRKEQAAEVNGKPARIIDTRLQTNPPAFGEVQIKLEWVRRLQEQFDMGKITIPGVKAEDYCRVKESRPHKGTAVEVCCPHRAVLREVQVNTCHACSSHRTNTIVYLCLLHAITHHGAGTPIADMGPLFVDPVAVAQSAEDHKPTPMPPSCPNCMEPLNGKSHFDGEVFSCDDIDVLISNGATILSKTVNLPKKKAKT